MTSRIKMSGSFYHECFTTNAMVVCGGLLVCKWSLVCMACMAMTVLMYGEMDPLDGDITG